MNRFHAVRLRSRMTAATAIFAATALFAVPAARADFPFPPTPHELHHDVRALVHDVLRTLDRIPVEIHGGYVGNLEPFLVGNVYFGPHHHYHATYSFPVWFNGGVEYRPYVYCNSRLYGSYDTRPQFWTGWGVESQGRWCGHHHAYYPSVHACFRPQYRQSYNYGYGSRHGSEYRQQSPQYRSDYRSGNGSGYRPQSRQQYGSDHHSGNGAGYQPQYNSNRGSGYRSSAGSHDGSRDRSHKESKSRKDDHRRQDNKQHSDGGRQRH